MLHNVIFINQIYACMYKPKIHMKHITVALPEVEREKEVVGIKEEKKKKRDLPKEAGSIDTISKRRKNGSYLPKIASVYCLRNVSRSQDIKCRL